MNTTINQTLSIPAFTLCSASDMILARRIGQKVRLDEITHGDKSARVTVEESNKNRTLIVIDYKGEVYELTK